jgi:hypothetical protein
MISKKIGVLLLLALIMLVTGLFIPPIAQPLTYHDFADSSPWLGINNAWNVLSNISFALVGIWGLFLLLSPGKSMFVDGRERWIWIGLSLGLILVAVGSGYYHLAPDNTRLVWDRLPMTLVFMSFVASLIFDRIDSRLGFCVWPLLLILGIYSVLAWYASELRGAGDLRLYAALQGYTAITALVMWLMPSHYTPSWDIALVVLFYCLAKGFEVLDSQIYQLSGHMVSGHTLKHLAGAIAGAWLIRMMWKRRIKK